MSASAEDDGDVFKSIDRQTDSTVAEWRGQQMAPTPAFMAMTQLGLAANTRFLMKTTLLRPSFFLTLRQVWMFCAVGEDGRSAVRGAATRGSTDPTGQKRAFSKANFMETLFVTSVPEPLH